jgi:hypothetical protein
VTPEELRLVRAMEERWGSLMDEHVAQAPPIAPEVAERISALLSEAHHASQRP